MYRVGSGAVINDDELLVGIRDSHSSEWGCGIDSTCVVCEVVLVGCMWSASGLVLLCVKAEVGMGYRAGLFLLAAGIRVVVR